MVMRAANARRMMNVRRCVSCGFAGPELRNGLADQCQECGCDLRVRPARSYAEMEGLETPAAREESSAHSVRPPVLERWLAFTVLLGACGLAIAYLISAMTL